MSSKPSDPTSFLKKHYPSSILPESSEVDVSQFTHSVFPKQSYTENEKVEISQWLTTSSRLAVQDEDEAKHLERLGSLNIHLSTRTTLLGSKPSIADVALYYRLAPAVNSWSVEMRTGDRGYHHIVRHTDFVQNAPLFGLSLQPEEKVKIDVDDIKHVLKPSDPKEEKERKKKEKAAAGGATAGQDAAQKPLVVGTGKDKGAPTGTADPPAAAAAAATAATSTVPGTNKKEKKEKPAKQPKNPPPKAETILSPCLIDLRVGHILRAIPHPNADSLYVSTIACGDAPGTDNTSLDESTGQTVRTVCSGLNGLIPLEEMQDRKIVAVCNLKPVTMRGVKSAAMVLAASPRLAPGEEDNHKGPVELAEIPPGAEAGERICFAGWEGEPEGVLNPKKKIWETLQPGFTTDGEGNVGFDRTAVEALKGDAGAGAGAGGQGVGLLKTKSGGVCKVKTLKGAVVR